MSLVDAYPLSSEIMSIIELLSMPARTLSVAQVGEIAHNGFDRVCSAWGMFDVGGLRASIFTFRSFVSVIASPVLCFSIARGSFVALARKHTLREQRSKN